MTFESVPCVVARCDGCQGLFQASEDEYTVHYDSTAEATAGLEDSEWLVAADDTITCRRCVEKRLCELGGHSWSEWRENPRADSDGRYRVCAVCGDFDHDPPIDRTAAK